MIVIYTHHAETKIAMRAIRKETVESILAAPDKTLDLGAGKKQAVKTITGEKISVIYVVENNKIIVLTVHRGE